MKIVAAMTAALVLAACGQTGGNAANAVAAAKPKPADARDYVGEIRGMLPELRRGTFLRAIRDAQQPCQEVIEEHETETVNGQAAWSASCENGADWIIIVERDGNAKVTNGVDPKPKE